MNKCDSPMTSSNGIKDHLDKSPRTSWTLTMIMIRDVRQFNIMKVKFPGCRNILLLAMHESEVS